MGRLRWCKHQPQTLASHIFSQTTTIYSSILKKKKKTQTHTPEEQIVKLILSRSHISVPSLLPLPKHYPSFSEETGKKSEEEIHAK